MINSTPFYNNFSFLNGDVDSFQENDDEVFILMPFGKSERQQQICNDIYHKIRETVEENCFGGGIIRCSRADFESNLIVMSDICHKIKKAGLTIFDISYPNTNVYFELGLACALDKKILLTFNSEYYYSNSDQTLPFDINQFRYLEYSDFDRLKLDLKQKVEELISLDDFREADIDKVYKKVQKISRHLGIDTKADQIREDRKITDHEIKMTCDVLDEYWDDKELEENNFKGIDYINLELKVRKNLKTDNWHRVKDILRYIYWNGRYQQLIAHLDNANFADCYYDYQEQIKQFEDEA